MIFFCPHCQQPLEASGSINKLVCLRCRCIFLVKIELQEIKGPHIDPNIRQLTGAEENEGSTGTETSSRSEEFMSDGAFPRGEGNIS